ncbi:MAG: GGDEF domain-containing protein, partial [Syntrophales bacterium LBB04]|nr:GGDEF domain-containing protein [Syntrophales bacterium LBB04]
LYLLPIVLVTWYINKRSGVIISGICGCMWFLADIPRTGDYHHPIVSYWNAIVMLGIFLVFAFIVAAFKATLDKEMQISRTDPLTGADNSRYFFELAAMEINRAMRYAHPFAVAYFDLDNFKEINDRFGHSTGDEVLRVVKATVSQNLRTTDIFARLGGDEFAIMLPETGDTTLIGKLIGKLQEKLLSAMEEKGWPVTFSIGVIVYLEPPASLDELIQLPDNLMYSVKKSGKNMIRIEAYGKSVQAIKLTADKGEGISISTARRSNVS